MAETSTPLDYVMQYGGRCRGCADHGGICPGDFMPCDPATKRSAVSWVIGALEYGRRHGYIVDAPPARTEAQARLEALEAGLEPFAKMGRLIDGPFGPRGGAGTPDGGAFVSGGAWSENGKSRTVTWGDFRRAAALLSGSTPKPAGVEITDEMVERAARAHDAEESALKGEPSPWTHYNCDGLYPTEVVCPDCKAFRDERLSTMRVALTAALAAPAKGE